MTSIAHRHVESRVHGMTTSEAIEAMPELTEQFIQRAPAEAAALTEWSRKWLAAWNSHDVAATVALVSEDFVYEDPSMFGDHIVGRDQFAEFLRMVWRAFPDLSFEIFDTPYLAVLGSGAAIPWRAIGTFAGDMKPGPSPLPLAPTNRRFDIKGVDLYKFRDGQLAHWISVLDTIALAQQFGLVPAARTPAFNLVVRAQRLLAPLLRATHRR